MARAATASFILTLLLPWPLRAQPLDCTAPQTQIEMTGCAARDYDFADADLNAVWSSAMDMARSLDQGLPAGQVPAATILRDAQRAWIAYRDQACEAESLRVRGGSMQPQAFYICLARLTRSRTRDLADFAAQY